jgi:predicted MFS family arabinose efflux permease
MSQQAAMPPRKAAAKIPGYAWVVLFATYMATLAAPVNQMKVPPLMTILNETFKFTPSRAGDLMAYFSIMGFVLAIPAGLILRKFGIKITMLIAVGSIMIGACVGAMSATSDLLFAGRIIEGIGMGLIMVAAPSAISLWFPAEKRALPMGVWASSIGVGSIAALNLGPAMAIAHGWRSVWWIGASIAAVAFILFALLFRMPKKEEMVEPPPQSSANAQPEQPAGFGKALANPNLWLICIIFGSFNLVVMAWSTFYPNFLEKVRFFSPEKASFITSIMMGVAIISAPLGGFISDRVRSRKALIIVPFILLAISLLLPFSITGWMIPAFMIYTGIVLGPIAPVCLSAVPEIMPSPQLIGVGLGVVAMGQNLGMFIGPSLFGRLLERFDFATAGYLMIPICVVAIICAWIVKIR